jgi:hypothetical protein
MPMTTARSFRGWLATWLQDRRRLRKQMATPPPAPTPNAPVITGVRFEWGTSEPEYADVWVDWTFDHGTLPLASIEVFVSVDGGDFGLVATVPSNFTGFHQSTATLGEAQLTYQVRYRDGTTFGPWSNAYLVDVQV